MSLILTPLTEQSLVNKTIGYEVITRYTSDFAGKKRSRIQANEGIEESDAGEDEKEDTDVSAKVDGASAVKDEICKAANENGSEAGKDPESAEKVKIEKKEDGKEEK